MPRLRMPVLKDGVKVLAWTDLVMTVVQFFGAIYYLVVFSGIIRDSLKLVNPKVLKSEETVAPMIIRLTIKIFYFLILFLIGEIILTLYLLRAVSRQRLSSIRIWLIVSSVGTALYVTDLISTFHAGSLLEDFSVPVSVFIKIPLLICVYKYFKQLSMNGENLVNNDVLII
ncbi:unnamed protein product [Allacma fusca]|uniref:DUF2569 domain-containing protein n=1 Tax=Allacma fusca TaxID=39272 RepID=A0A8J2MDW3_9HEXA|nr:unnamed protein product [Allacma fusca]